MDLKKRWDDHASFLGRMAGYVAYLMIADGQEKADAIEDYTNWLSNACFHHAAKHCAQDAVKGSPVHFNQKREDRANAIGKVVASREYPRPDGWQSFEGEGP